MLVISMNEVGEGTGVEFESSFTSRASADCGQLRRKKLEARQGLGRCTCRCRRCCYYDKGEWKGCFGSFCCCCCFNGGKGGLLMWLFKSYSLVCHWHHNVAVLVCCLKITSLAVASVCPCCCSQPFLYPGTPSMTLKIGLYCVLSPLRWQAAAHIRTNPAHAAYWHRWLKPKLTTSCPYQN